MIRTTVLTNRMCPICGAKATSTGWYGEIWLSVKYECGTKAIYEAECETHRYTNVYRMDESPMCKELQVGAETI